MKSVFALFAVAALTACGLGETAATAAVAGKNKANEVEQAQALEQRIASEIEKANQQRRERLDASESR
jgi:hypothetical protein